VKEFVVAAFEHVELDWEKYVVSDPRFMRPAEVDYLVGDASKAKKELDWQPEFRFKDLVRLMVDADLKRLEERSH
jgi:GDPmannose 4,6-dehydratase